MAIFIFVGSENKAELSALQRELRGVYEWFQLGIELKIDDDRLLGILSDFKFTADCRIHMLVAWKELEVPTWPRIIEALINIGRGELALKLTREYIIGNLNLSSVHIPCICMVLIPKLTG